MLTQSGELPRCDNLHSMLVQVLLLAVLSQAPATPLTVSAAVSLTEALQEVAAAYRATGGAAVSFNFAGSNVLARQIVNGAPVDVFVSADEAQMDVVSRAGLVVPGSLVTVAGNALVLVADERTTIRSISDLGNAEVRRIAIGDPAAVPAGVYARRYLEEVGLWSRLEPKVVPVGNVRAALTAVQNGSAAAAFVYATDARVAPDLKIVATIAGARSPRIVYPACVIKTTRQPAAAVAFLAFVRSPAGAAILARHGFAAPPR
jgi:molybdate transport system substrate-binding protein